MASRRTKKLKFFYLNGDLHKSLHIDRASDTIMAWNYPQERRVGYVYSDVRRMHERPWTTVEVAKMVNRSRLTLVRAIERGEFNPPQKTYNIETRSPGLWLWNEKHIMDLHEYLSGVHKGRPRNDGRVTPMTLPNRNELRAMVRQQSILYVQTDKGEFVPTWQAENF